MFLVFVDNFVKSIRVSVLLSLSSFLGSFCLWLKCPEVGPEAEVMFTLHLLLFTTVYIRWNSSNEW